MLIAIVDFHVAAQDRAAAVDFLVEEGKEMIKLAGNAGHRVLTEAGSETHVGLIHEWKTPEDFSAYIASPLFTRSGEVLRPMMIAPPASRRLLAETFEDVDGLTDGSAQWDRLTPTRSFRISRRLPPSRFA